MPLLLLLLSTSPEKNMNTKSSEKAILYDSPAGGTKIVSRWIIKTKTNKEKGGHSKVLKKTQHEELTLQTRVKIK